MTAIGRTIYCQIEHSYYTSRELIEDPIEEEHQFVSTMTRNAHRSRKDLLRSTLGTEQRRRKVICIIQNYFYRFRLFSPWSGKETPLLKSPPLRTARDTFASSRSSLSYALCRTRFHHVQPLAMDLSMAIWVEQDAIIHVV